MRDISKKVKKSGGILFSALFGLGFVGCQAAHDVAVSSFRVIDAPANYVRQHIDRSNPPPNAPVASDSVTPGHTVNPTTASNQRPQQQSQQSAAAGQTQSQPKPTVAPRSNRTVTSTDTSKPVPAPSEGPHGATTQSSQMPTAKPVPGKPGYVYSPFDPNGGYVDVSGFSPGSKAKDPYSGKIFLVP